MKRQTHFGFETIDLDQKNERISNLFGDVAPYYDKMNDIMSLGLHHLWKKQFVEALDCQADDHVLDLATGTGDIATRIHHIVGKQGQVICLDLNEAMLTQARDNHLNAAIANRIEYIQASAEHIPLQSDLFNVVTISFGLRNTASISQTLTEMHRVLVPGGVAGILEFSHPSEPRLKQCYHQYLLHTLPIMGMIGVNDQSSYRYLAESIVQHPNAMELKRQMIKAGFNVVEIIPILGGTVAIHLGYKAYV